MMVTTTGREGHVAYTGETELLVRKPDWEKTTWNTEAHMGGSYLIHLN